VLGATQIVVSVTVNAMIALSAGSIAAFLAARPAWAVAQRWIMATVLGGLAVRMATESRR
jgi:threonine/homoserine/homoserine lactone efflux protein